MATPTSNGRGRSAAVLWAVVALVGIVVGALVALYTVASDHGRAPDISPIFAAVPGAMAAAVGLLLHQRVNGPTPASPADEEATAAAQIPQQPTAPPYTPPPALPTAQLPGGTS